MRKNELRMCGNLRTIMSEKNQEKRKIPSGKDQGKTNDNKGYRFLQTVPLLTPPPPSRRRSPVLPIVSHTRELTRKEFLIRLELCKNVEPISS